MYVHHSTPAAPHASAGAEADTESSSASERPQSRVSSSGVKAGVQATGLLRNLAVSGANTGAFAAGGVAAAALGLAARGAGPEPLEDPRQAEPGARLRPRPGRVPGALRTCGSSTAVPGSEQSCCGWSLCSGTGTESVPAREMILGIPGAIDVFVVLLRMYLDEPSVPQCAPPPHPPLPLF